MVEVVRGRPLGRRNCMCESSMVGGAGSDGGKAAHIARSGEASTVIRGEGGGSPL